MKEGIIFTIKHFAVHDGPGIRTTVFLKGCPLKCQWCHNPEGQNKSIEIFDRIVCVDGVNLSEPIVNGEVFTVNQIINEIEKDLIFYDESNGGVTFSGGEPLLQPDFTLSLLNECKSASIHTALDTCGYAAPKTFKKFIGKADLFLYDLKFVDEQLHLKHTSKSNKWILHNLDSLLEADQNVILRFPVIPDITDTEQNISTMMSYFEKFKRKLPQIDLLPFHNYAETKYKRFHMINKTKDTVSVSTEKLMFLKEKLKTYFLKVNIGG